MTPRRAFLGSLTLGLLAEALPAWAQPVKKPWRIGYLSGGSSPVMAPYVAAFREGLRNRGLIEGENIVVEYRWADGNNEKLPALAGELVALKVDLLVASGTPAAVAAKRATSQIPIVFTTVSDPVASGLVASLARPGGNATGWSTILPDMGGKLLGLIREAVPSASRIALLANPTNPGKGLELTAMRDQAPSLGVTIQSVEVPTPASLDAAFSTMGSARPDILVTLFDAVTLSNRGRIVEFAAKAPHPGHLSTERIRRCRRSHVLRAQSAEHAPAHGPLRRADPQGRQACRPARRAADHVRACHQPQDLQGARPDHPAVAAGAGG